MLQANHFVCRTYLRGFLSSCGKLDVRNASGKVIQASVEVEDIEFEEAPAEPAIERLREGAERKWGEFRKALETNPPWPLTQNQKGRIAHFLAVTILMARSGRSTVRSNRVGKECDPEWGEDKVIDCAIRIYEKRFLTMKCLMVKPATGLICGEMPVVFQHDGSIPTENANSIIAAWFPLTQNYLLYLNERDEDYYAFDDLQSKFSLEATKRGCEANEGLVKCARTNDSKIYIPAGRHWPFPSPNAQ
jgi:hypothetical protein